MKTRVDHSRARWGARLAIIGRFSIAVLVVRVPAVFLGAPVRHTLVSCVYLY